MASTRRRQRLTVVQQLLNQPHSFAFFQAVRLLERAAVLDSGQQRFAIESVASQALPNREALRFFASQDFSFASSPINKISIREVESFGDGDAPGVQWAMQVSFMGLSGSQGVMPYYLSDLILRELRQKNFALSDFLDVFNHRSISFYYQAWHKYRLPVNVERHRQRNSSALDGFTHSLCSLAGIAHNEIAYRTPLQHDVMAGMAGLLGRPVTTADGLKRMIKHCFGLLVDIEQFKGQWQQLPEDVLCRLPDEQHPEGVNNCLGVNVILGTSCHHAQSKFRVVVAPLNYDDFDSIAPGGKKLEALKSFIKFAVGGEMDFEISVTLNSNSVSPVRLSDESGYRPQLGWNTHMQLNQTAGGEPYEIVLDQDIDSPDEVLPQAR